MVQRWHGVDGHRGNQFGAWTIYPNAQLHAFELGFKSTRQRYRALHQPPTRALPAFRSASRSRALTVYWSRACCLTVGRRLRAPVDAAARRSRAARGDWAEVAMPVRCARAGRIGDGRVASRERAHGIACV